MKQIFATAMGILSLGSFNVEASEITGLEAEAVIVFGEVIRRDLPFYLFDGRSKIFYDEIHFDERVYYCAERLGFKTVGARKVPNKIILICYDTED